MSFLTGKSKVILEKDYTEQLIFSKKLPDASKNRFYMVIIGILFFLFVANIVSAMEQSNIIERFL